MHFIIHRFILFIFLIIVFFSAKNFKEEIPLNDEEALAFLVNNNFSKSQHHAIRMTSINHNSKIYPPYNKVRDAKSKCFPPNIEIDELENLCNY